MDIDLVIERLKTLEISYNEGECELQNLSSAEGIYFKDKNKIEIYKCDSFEKMKTLPIKMSTFYHEFFHVLQSIRNDNRYMLELSNEAFTRETIRRMIDMGELDKELFKINDEVSDNRYIYGNGYSSDIHVFYDFAEMMDKEELGYYQFSGDYQKAFMKHLIKIDQINKQDENASKQVNVIQLFEAVDELRVSGYKSSEKYENAKQELLEKIDFYYKQQKGISIEDDLRTVAIKENKLFKEPEDRELREMLEKKNDNVKDVASYEKSDVHILYNVVPRSYFSSEYPETVIQYKVYVSDNDILPQWCDLKVDNELCNEYCELKDEVVQENFDR